MNWKVPVERNKEDSRNVKQKQNQKQEPLLLPITTTENLEKQGRGEEKGRDRTGRIPEVAGAYKMVARIF